MTCIFSTSKPRLALVMTRGAPTLSRTTLSLIQSGSFAFLASIIMPCWVHQFTHCYVNYHSVKCHSDMCRFDECCAKTFSRMTLSLIQSGLLASLASIILSCWVSSLHTVMLITTQLNVVLLCVALMNAVPRHSVE
jgi:hypothetical protein